MGRGLWQTAAKALMRRVLVDTRQCGVHASAVLAEPFTSATIGPANSFSGKKPLPAEGTVRPVLLGVRLRVEGGRISEIESIIAPAVGQGTRVPFGLCPGRRNVLTRSAWPQTVMPGKRLYQGPSGTSGSGRRAPPALGQDGARLGNLTPGARQADGLVCKSSMAW